MATSKKRGGGRAKSGKPKEKTASTRLLHPLRNMQAVSRLCQKMAAGPDVETARELHFRADELESFFGEIRRNTHQYLDAVAAELAAENQSSAAVAALGKIVAPPEAPSGEIEIQPPPAESPLAPAGAAAPQRLEFLMRAPALRPAMAAAAPPRAASDRKKSLEKGQLDLDTFFQSVAKAVIDAQQTLDSMSLHYALQQQKELMPGALYSIPNVKAEIRAGLSSTGGPGLIVSLFKGDKSTSYSDSTISFDVVSSPPPPGRLDRYTTAIPKFLVVEGSDREKVLDAIVKSAAPPAEAGWRDRTVVLRDLNPALSAPGKQAFFALTPGPFPQPDEDGSVDFSNATLVANMFEEPASLTSIAIPAGAARFFLFRLATSIAQWVGSVTAAPAK